MTDPSAVYRETRERVIKLFLSLDEEELARKVPACPEWSVRDLVAHLTGCAADWMSGAVDGYGTDAWTTAQVRSRAGNSLQQILEEWDELAPRFEASLNDPAAHGWPDRMPALTIADIATHEQDLREMLGALGAEDSEAVAIGLGTRMVGLDRRVREAGLVALTIVASDVGQWTVGAGDPDIEVRAPQVELFRSVSGRRSRAATESFDWTGEPGPYLDVWLPQGYAWPD